MTTENDICLRAGLAIGSRQPMADFRVENSPLANVCKLFYDSARRELLESHDWGFAKQYRTLTDLGSPVGKWSYQYAYPSDCIGFIEIYRTTDSLIEYEEALVNDTRSILTDKESAVAVYTKDVTSPSAWSPLFESVMVAYMASLIAVPLMKSPQREQAAYAKFLRLLPTATAKNANRNRKTVDQRPSWVRKRGG